MSGPQPIKPSINRTYGRIKARPIKPRQGALFETLLPKIRTPEGALDPVALMPAARETWLEIGFGGGEHLAAQAARNPDVLLIGAEPFLNGAASALRHVDEQQLANVRLHIGDGRDVLAALPDAALGRVFILFPDPWPKTRHHKRRLIQPDVLAEIVRVLKPCGTLRFATDVEDYANWTLQRALKTPGLVWTAERSADWSSSPADHVTTRYETKKLGDCSPIFLDFERAP